MTFSVMSVVLVETSTCSVWDCVDCRFCHFEYLSCSSNPNAIVPVKPPQIPNPNTYQNVFTCNFESVASCIIFCRFMLSSFWYSIQLPSLFTSRPNYVMSYLSVSIEVLIKPFASIMSIIRCLSVLCEGKLRCMWRPNLMPC